MTPPRPFEEEVGYAIQWLWMIAELDTAGFRLIARILNQHLHVLGLIATAEAHAAYGPGGGFAPALGTTDASPVEARLYWPNTTDPDVIRRFGQLDDRLVRAYRRLGGQFRREETTLADRMWDGINKAERNADGQEAG